MRSGCRTGRRTPRPRGGGVVGLLRGGDRMLGDGIGGQQAQYVLRLLAPLFPFRRFAGVLCDSGADGTGKRQSR